MLLQYVSASLGHHQVYIILLKLLHRLFRMSRVNALLFLILKYLKSLKVRRNAGSSVLHVVYSVVVLFVVVLFVDITHSRELMFTRHRSK
jgi:hypothetical protein